MLGLSLSIKSPDLYLLYDIIRAVIADKTAKFQKMEDKKSPEAITTAGQVLYFLNEVAQFEKKIEQERTEYFQFSVEELYRGFGQFDRFIHIELHRFSDASKKFGNEIGGVIIYTKAEREKFQQQIASEDPARTKGNIRLNVIGQYNLDEDQRKELLNTGLCCGDIYQISRADTPVHNAFLQAGEKTIPGTINVEVDFSKMDPARFQLHYLQSRIKNDAVLLPNEWDQYWGCRLYLSPDIAGAERFHHYLYNTEGVLEDGIQFHHLGIKGKKGELTSGEREIFSGLLKKRRIEREAMLSAELKKNNMKSVEEFKEMHPAIYRQLSGTLLTFEDAVLSDDKLLPIFWDFKSYLHIFLRHCRQLQPDGQFKDRTPFLYTQKDIHRLVRIAIERLKPAIKRRLEEGKDFRSANSRSLYFNGNYYALRIEMNGRLDSFYPYGIKS